MDPAHGSILKAGFVIVTVKMEKLRHREVGDLPGGHTAVRGSAGSGVVGLPDSRTCSFELLTVPRCLPHPFDSPSLGAPPGEVSGLACAFRPCARSEA